MEIIKLKEEQIKLLEFSIKKNNDAEVAFQEASHLLRISNNEIWDTIKKMFPKKVIRKGHCDWKHKEIVLVDVEDI